MSKKIDRTGEEKLNNFGSKMIIKEVIDSYKGKIPEPFYSRLREAMYNYKVEIDD